MIEPDEPALRAALDRIKHLHMLMVEVTRDRVENHTASPFEEHLVREFDKAWNTMQAERIAIENELDTDESFMSARRDLNELPS